MMMESSEKDSANILYEIPSERKEILLELFQDSTAILSRHFVPRGTTSSGSLNQK